MLAVDLNLPPHPHLAGVYWGVPEATHAASPARLPLDALFVLLGKVSLVGAGEKAVLLAAIFAAGLGMHRLAPSRSNAGRYFAGALFAVNPWVYDRLWSGQWFVVLGYALIPWGVASFLSALRGERAAAFRFGILAAACGIASGHMAILLGVACVAIAIGTRQATRAAIPAAFAIALSLYWLLPAPGISSFWDRIGSQQLDYYRSVPAGRWGIGTTLAALSGYWNDASPITSTQRLWPAFAAVLVVLAVAGLVVRRSDPVAWALAVVGVGALLFAAGVSTEATRGAFTFLLVHVRPLRSFREPQKAMALVVLVYAYLGAAAVDDLLRGARRPGVRAVSAALLVAVPLVFSYRELYGLWGRMHTTSFPSSWTEARPLLPRGSRTLFLPWSGYLELSFARYREVANPAPSFFPTPILASRAIGGTRGTLDIGDAEEIAVARLVARPAAPELGRCLAHRGVGAILVADEPGSAVYAGLAARKDLTLVRRWGDLVLYRLDPPGGLLMRGGSAPCGPVAPVAARLDDPAHLTALGAVPRRPLLGVSPTERWVRQGARTFAAADWPDYRRNYAIGALAALVALIAGGLRRRLS